MNVYRKSLVIQIILFVVFFLMGLNLIVQYYVAPSFSAYHIVVLAVLITAGLIGFLIYKKMTDDIVPITEKHMKWIRGLLYGYLVVYVVELVVSGLPSLPTEALKIVFSSVLMIIALVGIGFQVHLLTKKEDL